MATTKKKLKKTVRKKPVKPVKPIFDGLVYQTNHSCAFRLLLYKTNPEMIKGIEIWGKKNDYHVGENDSYAAVCFSEKPHTKIIHDAHGKEWLMYATAFMNLEDLRSDPFLVVHECLHMVIDRERSVFRYDGVFGDRPSNGNDPEERICYCLQDIVAQTYKKILELMPSLFVAMEVNLTK